MVKWLMYIIAEKFIGRYKRELEDFIGNIVQFYPFGNIIDEYLII